MVVKQATAALVEAANIFNNQSAQALSKEDNYDEFFRMKLSGGDYGFPLMRSEMPVALPSSAVES
jgi:hypothetical protein